MSIYWLMCSVYLCVFVVVLIVLFFACIVYCYIVSVYVRMYVFVDVSIVIVSCIFVCMWFVYALVRKNGIVRALEFKLLINQSINSGLVQLYTTVLVKVLPLKYLSIEWELEAAGNHVEFDILDIGDSIASAYNYNTGA